MKSSQILEAAIIVSFCINDSFVTSSPPYYIRGFSVPNVSWWINPTHARTFDYSICHCLWGPHQWNEHREHLARFISYRVCPVQATNNGKHSVRAGFMICINSLGLRRTPHVAFWDSHQSRRCPDFSHMEACMHNLLWRSSGSTKGMHYSMTCKFQLKKDHMVVLFFFFFPFSPATTR